MREYRYNDKTGEFEDKKHGCGYKENTHQEKGFVEKIKKDFWYNLIGSLFGAFIVFLIYFNDEESLFNVESLFCKILQIVGIAILGFLLNAFFDD